MITRALRAWRPRLQRAYRGVMPIGRRGGPAPVPQSPDLEPFRGQWVAVANGKVVAAGKDSRELAFRLSKLPDSVRRAAVMQKVHKPSSEILVGMG